MNEQLKSQVLEQLKSANNVLVAVSSNPTVDELSASIALTLLLNKMNKHATAVFSGVVPSTLEFLQPDKTIETTTDSLRDFIIALDKSKADKLRYKVEDDVVRIFITPYRTSISDKDLEFSQGDFNVDVVLALGVTKREDLDRAITAHGRILHDATVVSLTKRDVVSQLGSMNWQEPQASSLCEMVSVLCFELARESIDGQMATALMTGIIAETDRFRNDKTTPLALSLSSQLMSAGANQQLIAEKLEQPEPITEAPHPMRSAPAEQLPAPVTEEAKKGDDGELAIEHEEEIEKIHIDEHGNLSPSEEEAEQPPQAVEQKPMYMDEPVTEAEYPIATSDADSDTTHNMLEPIEESPEPVEMPTDNEDSDYGNSPTTVEPEEPSRDLDTPTESNDKNDAAAVPSADHAVPTMTHGKTILPPSHNNNSLSDKPFDLQEALKKEIAKDETAAGNLPETPQPTPQPPAPTQPQIPQPLWPIASTEQPTPTPPATKDKSLLELEKSIDSPHVKNMQDLDSVRDSVAKAADSVVSPFPTPSKSLGAQPVEFQENTASTYQNPPVVNTPKVIDPNAAPPVPPPMPLTPQFYDEDGNNSSV